MTILKLRDLYLGKRLIELLISDLADQAPEESDFIPQEDATDITPFLFPAIGALLMLMFGGLLFSSGTTLCKTKALPDNKYKRQFEKQYGRRTIRFHNVPKKIAKEPRSVLQQENNDIVDAVKKEYQDLPQYQPVSGLVGSIVGLHGQTCSVNICRPEVVDRGASPVHCMRNENTSDYENPSYREQESDIGLENDSKEDQKLSIRPYDKYPSRQDNDIERIPTGSSGIGTNSPESFENDSLEEFLFSENGSQPLDEAAVPESTGSGFPVDSTRSCFVPRIDRGVYSGGRLSVLQLECAPSRLCMYNCDCSVHDHKANKMKEPDDVLRRTKERLTWGDVAQNINTRNLTSQHLNESDADKTCSGILRLGTPSADVSGLLTVNNLQERKQSPLKRADLEKWLNDVEEFRKVSDESYTKTLFDSSDAETDKLWKQKPISCQRRTRAPLQESQQLLKRLELVSEDDLQLAQKKSPVHRGGRKSCLKTVRAPSSLCLCAGNCGAYCQIDVPPGQSFAPTDTFGESTDIEGFTDILRSQHQFSSTRTERITKGGRWSTLNHVRASSGMCIHGPSCQFHCQKIGNVESITEAAEQKGGSGEIDARKDQELHPKELHWELTKLRGASSFGEGKDSHKYSKFQSQGITHSTSGQRDFQKEECREDNFRGASSFEGLNSAITQQNRDQDTRGASSFALDPQTHLHIDNKYAKQTNDAQSNLDETRGASCFAPLEESIVGTSSVTLSIAVESEGESFPADTFADKKGSDSTLNQRSCLDKPRDRKREFKTVVKHSLQRKMLQSADNFKENLALDLNSNLSVGHAMEHSGNHAKDRKVEEKERQSARESTPEGKPVDEQQHKSKNFDKRILKVGKDATMMCTLLNALRREGEQKRKGHSGDSVTKRNVRENVTNGNETLAGNLKFLVLYKGAGYSTPLLYVSVLGLEGVSDEIITPSHSVYVKFCLLPKFTTWRKTKMLHISDKQLVFKDHFIISGVKPVDLDEAILRFVAVCVREEEKVIGQLEVPLAELKTRVKLKRTCAFHALSARNDGTAE